MNVCHMHMVPPDIEEGIRYLGTGLTNGYEMLYGAENQIWFLCKSIQCF